MMELKALDGKRLQALNHIMIKKKRWLGPIIRESGERVLKKWSSFGRWCCPTVLQTKLGKWSPNWKGPLNVHQVLLENAIGYQALKESHTKGSLMGSTSRNTFLQCGKCWIVPRKTKMRNEGITGKNRTH